MNMGNIMASLSLNISNFMSGLSQATAALTSFQSSANSAFNGASGGADDLSNHLKSVERIVEGITISQVFYQITEDIKKAVSATADFMMSLEKAQVAFQYFTGSQQSAQSFIYNMEDFAAKTPFNTAQALDMSRRLMAANFDPTKVRSVMTILSDSASATGGTADQLDRIVQALAEMNTGADTAARQLRMLSMDGIPAYQIVSQQLGIPEGKVADIGKLNIPGPTVVDALLKGLKERYNGAGAALSDTMGGMMETIKDDSMMVGQSAFAPLYNALDGVVTKVRDVMEKLRNEGFHNGLSGILKSIFSPQELQMVEVIVGSLESLAQSAGRIASAFQPAVQILGGAFLQAIAMALPIIAGFVRYIALIIQAVMQAAPWLQYLAAAIMGILVANFASSALLMFWRIVGLGKICTSIANAVMTLVKAMQMLAIAMLENPEVLIFVILAAGASYFILQIKGVQDALGGLWSSLSKFAGFNMGDIFSTPQINNAADGVNQFNGDVLNGIGNLNDVGNAIDNNANKAANAAKKAKNAMKDIMSFDEVHRLTDMGDDAKMPTIKAPKMPKPDLSGGIPGEGSFLNGLPGGPTLPNLKDSMNIGNLLGGSIDYKAMGRQIWNGFTSGISDGWGRFVGWWNGLGWDKLGAIEKMIPDPLGKLTDAMWKDLTKWGKGINDWAGRTKVDFFKWTRDVGKSVDDWSTKMGTDFNNWSADTKQKMGKWWADTKAGFDKWTNDVAIKVGTWSVDAGKTIKGWSDDAGKTISKWWTDGTNGFDKWSTDTKRSVGDWATNTGNTIGGWWNNTTQGFGNWSNNAGKSIGNWSSNAWHSITSWSGDTWNVIAGWWNNTINGFGNWAYNMGVGIHNGLINAKNMISTVFGNFYNECIRGPLNQAIDGLNGFIRYLDGMSLSIPSITIGEWHLKGISFNPFQMPTIPHLATGGIVLKDQLVRMGEGNKREAVVPLQNPAYMQPFSDAVAAQLMKSGALGGGGGGQQPTLMVGTLIADDRSLKELYRRMNVIQMKETNRGVSR